MDRRHFLQLALYAPLAALAASADETGKVTSLDAALRWLDKLDATPASAAPPRSTGTWPLAVVLAHLAQSIDMSIDGYPEAKSALFQQTAGAGAFAFFKWRGRMSHDLAAPIPGAPALPDGDWRVGAGKLRAAIKRFQAHNGALRPHFAYGDLDKADYAIAHTLHIANHQDQIAA